MAKSKTVAQDSPEEEFVEPENSEVNTDDSDVAPAAVDTEDTKSAEDDEVMSEQDDAASGAEGALVAEQDPQSADDAPPETEALAGTEAPEDTDVPAEPEDLPQEQQTREKASPVTKQKTSAAAQKPAKVDPSTAPARTEVVVPKRPSLWKRFGFWLRGIKPVVATEEQAPTQEAEKKPVDYEKELKKKLAALAKAQRLSAREAAEAEKLQVKLDSQREELERVQSWVEGLERSYFWNVRRRMASNIDRAKADLRMYEEAVNNVDLPERGDLVVLRKRFHKGFGAGLLIFGIPTALLFFIPWFAKATMPLWLLEFLASEFFSLMVFGLVALASGIVGLMRRAMGSERMSWWRMIRVVGVVFAIPMAIWGIARAQELLLVYVVPLIERWLATALLVLGISFFFYLVGILAVYYSGWSAFSRRVTEQLTALENVSTGYEHSQIEIRRLEALYEQTADWLELLAHSLYRPWKVDPGWETNQELRMTSESFPFALRVAHAVDSETSQVANLERLIGQRLMTQGWRNEAFEHTLAEIGKQMGFDDTHVTPEFLDADLPHQTNNSRALIRSFFEQSAATAQAGKTEIVQETGPTKDGHARFSDNYLVEVARRRLKELIEKTQSSVLSEARPEVEQIVEDPPQQIRFDAAVLDAERTTQDWDDFLRDALGYDEIVQPPLSTMTFTDEGAFAKDPESAETHILIPERLKASAPQPESDKIRIHALPDTGSGRSVELIVRFDAVGPVPFSHVRMVENATYRPSLANTQSDDDDSEL